MGAETRTNSRRLGRPSASGSAVFRRGGEEAQWDGERGEEKEDDAEKSEEGHEREARRN